MAMLRWGVLGTGNIARRFCAGVKWSRRGRVIAVGSRSLVGGKVFAAAQGIGRVHDGYAAAIADAEVDAIYCALPNTLHREWTVRALEAGKHVLCEKPQGMNEGEVSDMFATAKKKGCVLEEAFMYRCHPLTHAVKAAVQGGAIGELRMIRTSFCYAAAKIQGNVRFDAGLGGGALLDIGCYCVNFSRWFAGGEPVEVRAMGHKHETSVDDWSAGMMRFGNGIVATFTCGITVRADNTAYLLGSTGHIEIPIPWKPPMEKAVFVIVDAHGRHEQEVSAGQDVYGLEADDFAASILDGVPPQISEGDSLGTARVLDALRKQCDS